jgi:hypothetical protein
MACRLLYGFVLLEITCQIALLFETLGDFRVLMRGAAFAASLVLLLATSGSGWVHPARRWALLALAVVALGLFHPETASHNAGAAHLALYAAILAPLFWASGLSLSPAVFRGLLVIFWLFHTLSAAVGVLQMHYPGRFQPNVSSVIQGMGDMAEAYKIRLASGATVWRPMGLTDLPGGAAGAGLYAVVFGLGFLLHFRSGVLRLVSLGSLTVGLFCLYIAEVRSLLIMAGIAGLALLAILIRRGERQRVAAALLLVPPLVLATLLWAVSVGGESTGQRLSTLVEDRPDEVYSRNRGFFLAYTVTEFLPVHPLGAGLARWGMIRTYFVSPQAAGSAPIYVEIQWTGWAVDGGVPLIVAYATAVAVACAVSWRIALGNLPHDLPLWGALLLALNVGTVAITFNYTVFMSQTGMEFWLLNGALFAAAVRAAAAARAARRHRLALGRPGLVLPPARRPAPRDLVR